MRFTIRNYRPEDFRTLLAIDQSCFAPGIAYSAFELKTYIQRRKAFTFVAEETAETEHSTARGSPEGASVLGFLVGERTRAIGHIITLDVVAEARRHQVGSALLQLAETNSTRSAPSFRRRPRPIPYRQQPIPWL